MFLPLLLSVQALVNAQPDRMAPVVDPIPHQAEVDQLCAHALSHLRHFDAAPPMMGGIDGAQDTDVLHYNLDLEILPGSPNTLIGTNIITVRSLIDGLSTFDIQLHQNFNISAMQVNGVNAAWTRLSVAVVRVTLNPSFNTNDQFDLRVSYNGTPSSGGFGSINFSTQGGSPLIFTLSEPYYAHTWWPVKEDSRDKATGHMAFTVSNALEVASNGTLQGIDVVPGNKLRYRWATNYPTAPYLFSFSATNYNQFSDTWLYSTVDGDIEMPMQFFIYPGSDTPANRTNWLTTKPMLTTFSDLYGVYPFANEKYGIYQFGFGGGMEHQTMTGQGTFSLSVTAHELGHQWWGDMVTCGTWHDIWLNEGFATYSEALWEEFKPGSSGTPALHSAMASRRPSSMNTIVYRYDISSASIIFNTNAVYRKGAWVLHMLRHVVGDTAFFQIINSYGDQFAYATAITDDLQAVAESVYGSSLEWFFEPWIFQTGAPTYQYAWRNISAGGGSYLELFLKQNQDISWPTFSMPVDIVTTTGGSPTTTKVWNDARAEHLLFPVPGTVTALQVDPQNWILHPTSTTTTFLEGPPKIVKMTPAPGSSQSPAAVQSIQIVFHKNVNADAAHFLLNGQTAGSVPFTFAYSAGPMTATLTPNAPLAGDAYTLTVNAAITDALSGLALDGEVAQAASPASLPSGDGLPGGNAVLAFTIVAAPCPADVNASGNVDINDLLAVIGAWGPCSGCAGDVTGDGQVDIDDLLAVIGAWGPCP